MSEFPRNAPGETVSGVAVVDRERVAYLLAYLASCPDPAAEARVALEALVGLGGEE